MYETIQMHLLEAAVPKLNGSV